MDWMVVNSFASYVSLLALTSTHWSVRVIASVSVGVNGWLMAQEASQS